MCGSCQPSSANELTAIDESFGYLVFGRKAMPTVQSLAVPRRM